MDKESWIHRRLPYIALGIAIIVGIALLLWAGYLKDLWREIVAGLGISFITAGIIGAALELAFVTRIARNVFEVAFGYLLHPEIREEIKWIYEMDKLVTDYSHQFSFEQCDNDPNMVWVSETINRTVKNISNKSQSIEVGLGIQEWFHKEGRSQIISIKLTHEDGTELVSKEDLKITIERSQKTKQGNYILALKDDKLKRKLEPGKKYTWVATYRELRPKSADTVFWSATASLNPHVTVKILDDMDYDLTFGNRKQGELRDLGSDEWRLASLLLPGQAVRLRWWIKADSDKWKQDIAKG